MAMMNFKRFLLGGLSAISLAAAQPAAAETLADALISAYKTSNIIEQNRAVLRAADEDVADAVSALRPTISFIANANWIDPVQIPGANHLSGSIELVGQMILYDFGRTRLGIEIAKETVLATREALVGVEQEILLNAVRAYFRVRSASESVRLNRNSVRLLDETLRSVLDQFEVGEVTRTDVAQSEARLAGARASLSSAEGELVAAREAYKAATGHYPGVLAPPPPAPALPRTVAEARAIGLRTHPAVRQAQHQVLAADLGVSLAAAQRRPSLDGSVSVSRDDDGEDFTRLGVTFTQPIYTGGKLSSLHRKAIATRDQSRSGLQQVGVNVSQGVGTSFAQIEVSRAVLRASNQEVEAQQIAYDGVVQEARLGARTTLDVLDSEQSLLSAQTSRVQAAADLEVSIYSLLSSMGLLTVEHLNLGIPVYDPSAYYNAVKNAPPTSLQGRSLDRVLKAIGRN